MRAAFGLEREADYVGAHRTLGDTVFSLVAEEKGKIAGHVPFSKFQRPEDCLALERDFVVQVAARGT